MTGSKRVKQIVPGTSRLNPPPKKKSTYKLIVKSDAQRLGQGKLHVWARKQDSLTGNFIAEK
jgi:hypothetical protein